MNREKTMIYGTSVTGASHLDLGLPCQDSFGYAVLDTGMTVIAVADGLGSAPRSDEGSRTAVESVIRYFARKDLQEELAKDFDGFSERAVRDSFLEARQALEKKAQETGAQLNEFATTLLAVVAFGNSLVAANLGDGAVVGAANGGMFLISAPPPSGYENEVMPLTHNAWQSEVIAGPVHAGVESVAVFTDGIKRAALRKEEGVYHPFEGFFKPVFRFISGMPDPETAKQELTDLLGCEKIGEISDDDKTLVLALLPAGDRA